MERVSAKGKGGRKQVGFMFLLVFGQLLVPVGAVLCGMCMAKKMKSVYPGGGQNWIGGGFFHCII